ncbi:hypothetical protein GPA10_31925 [Streptomyces sp. p1417]|uniref:Uncharacterized protein n=1 Tax=Streptomyces typhae TaxID=2681492 RepID=A0A6L6X631_9ACTN|nr:DUF6221 family protein [Streptomyces typhae]MVO89241.1 hypothetical protein [Streptomyces typhae]
MPFPFDTSTALNTFERCEQLCRTAREAVGRAREIRSEAVRIRQEAAAVRAAMRHRRRQDDRSGPARPTGAPAPVHSVAAAQLTALAAFVHARLDEEVAATGLFHEPRCPAGRAPGAPDTPGTPGCRCPVPHRMHQDIAIRRSIVHTSQAAIRDADHGSPHWPHDELSALLHLKALALSYETHGLWQEEWRP